MRFHYVRREFLIASGDYIDGIFYWLYFIGSGKNSKSSFDNKYFDDENFKIQYLFEYH